MRQKHEQVKDNKQVKVWDIKTRTSTMMPARELAQGMIQVRLQADDGTEETVWTDGHELQSFTTRGPLQWLPFDEAARELLREIQASIAEHDPRTWQEWEDSLRRDEYPEREVTGWLMLARAYRRLTVLPGLSHIQRRETFQVLLCCLTAPRDQVMRVAPREVISGACPGCGVGCGVVPLTFGRPRVRCSRIPQRVRLQG